MFLRSPLPSSDHHMSALGAGMRQCTQLRVPQQSSVLSVSAHWEPEQHVKLLLHPARCLAELEKDQSFLQPMSTEPVMFSVISIAQEEEELNSHRGNLLSHLFFMNILDQKFCPALMQEDVPWSARETWEWDVELSKKRHKCQSSSSPWCSSFHSLPCSRHEMEFDPASQEGFPSLWTHGIPTCSRSNVDWRCSHASSCALAGIPTRAGFFCEICISCSNQEP